MFKCYVELALDSLLLQSPVFLDLRSRLGLATIISKSMSLVKEQLQQRENENVFMSIKSVSEGVNFKDYKN